MPASSRLETLLRVHAYKAELDFEEVRELLDLKNADRRIRSVSFNNEKGMVFVAFSGDASLTKDEIERWQTGEFRNAADWLRLLPEGRIDELRKKGLKIDLFVGAYWGLIPEALLREMNRLSLSLWTSP